MPVRRLTLSNMRSRRSLTVELGAGLNVLVGPNGAGKTTVLEGMALVLDGRTLRGGNVRDLVSAGQDHLRAEVVLDDRGTTVTAAAAFSRDGDRRLTGDGAPLADSSRWREVVALRSFVPDDLRLIKGSPRRRREYLDALTSRRDPDYSAVLKSYEDALGQRNALLRSYRGGTDDAQFVPWEKMMAASGLDLAKRREETLALFITAFQRMHRDLTGGSADTFGLTYRTNVAGLDEASYGDRLAGMRTADRQRTFTHLGPHRDDFRLVRAGLDMRDCASQGEQRAAVLTLVLAEWDYLRDKGPKTLLLLDDVMSELDGARRRALLDVVCRGGQVVITTTDLRYFTDEELSLATVIDLTEEGTPDGR
jgi:DNA replication and repair protein RecF